MAIATATLTVTITESLTLNGANVGGTNTLTVNTVNDFYKRIITVPTSEIVAWTTHDTDIAGSQFDDDLVKYARITNKGSNNVIVRVKNADNDELAYKLGPGESFLLHGHEATMNAVDAATLDIGTGWHDITSVKLTAPDGACDCELFIASI